MKTPMRQRVEVVSFDAETRDLYAAFWVFLAPGVS